MTFDELLALVSLDNAPLLCADSRLVKEGDVFVAIEGNSYDGHDFIGEALANGAKYIVCQRPQALSAKPEAYPEKENMQYELVIVEDSAKAAALLAQASRGNPASRLTNLAVTGTNGKTTVAFLVRSCIQAAGEACGLIGTVIYDTGSVSSEAVLTTPDCLAIAEMTLQMVKAGSEYMVIEASSHSLSQSRLEGINFKAAAFTNLGGDHLDYHKTKEDYLAAKTKLFEALLPDATAVLNKESSEAVQIAQKTSAKILWYAVDTPTQLNAHIESMDISETVFTLEYADQRLRVKTSLLGRHNVSNSLAAAGLCIAAGFDLRTIAAGLSALRTIPGRLERVDGDGGFSADYERDIGCLGGPTTFIDYAHTDDALRNVLSTLKPFCKAKLTVVFGCGGDRDRTKRPCMARTAEDLADFVIVTSDNPRTERPEDIIRDIIVGFVNPDSQKIVVEPDRRKAIELAINNASENDIVLIAGKGHETYQIIGKQRFDFNDKKIAQGYLKKLR